MDWRGQRTAIEYHITILFCSSIRQYQLTTNFTSVFNRVYKLYTTVAENNYIHIDTERILRSSKRSTENLSWHCHRCMMVRVCFFNWLTEVPDVIRINTILLDWVSYLIARAYYYFIIFWTRVGICVSISDLSDPNGENNFLENLSLHCVHLTWRDSFGYILYVYILNVGT